MKDNEVFSSEIEAAARRLFPRETDLIWALKKGYTKFVLVYVYQLEARVSIEQKRVKDRDSSKDEEIANFLGLVKAVLKWLECPGLGRKRE